MTFRLSLAYRLDYRLISFRKLSGVIIDEKLCPSV